MAHLCRTILRNPAMWSASRQLHMTSRAASVPILNGDLNKLAPKVRAYVDDKIAEFQPKDVHILDGSDQEFANLLAMMERTKQITRLPYYDNNWLVRTDPADVARVESKTVISTPNRRDTVPITAEGVEGKLGKWMSPEDMDNAYNERFPGCMRGRTMYVLPFSMGPVGSPLSKIGIELTDSPYVVACMRIMTRMGGKVLPTLADGDFIKCLHTVGQPLPMATPPKMQWPCNPPKTLIAHIPDRHMIASFGSGYGGNSLLGKKCLALRLGSIIARDEGWLAEHMLILGITNPQGVKKYIAAAFPSACGKTNLAMLEPSMPGYKVECVGDDICWMRFAEDGTLRAINPEAGFFGVAPGTSLITNKNAMLTCASNTIMTNTAETSDGRFYWEGMEDETPKDVSITSWLGEENWKPGGKPSAHPNSRFCTPASQCPIIDPLWEDPAGVPIEAILFGGRRPVGVPLVYEAFDWDHAVYIGATVRSETTAAAEHKGKAVMNDPFAMRPFFGYNFGHYMSHWLSMQNNPKNKLPKVYHVNWFLKDQNKKFMWPGFGENVRVIDWILQRLDGKDVARASPIGNIPKFESLNIDGLGKIDMDGLFDIKKDFWMKECTEVQKYFHEQVGDDLPDKVGAQLKLLEERVSKM